MDWGDFENVSGLNPMGAGNYLPGGINSVGGWGGIFGSGSNPGILGTGQYQTDPSKFQVGGPGGAWNGFAGAQGRKLPLGLGTMGTSWQDIYAGGAKQALNQQAPTLDGSQQGQVNAQQSQLGQMLMAQAQGGGPNPAAEQLKQSTNRNIAQAYAMAQANPNNAGAGRNIASNVAGINQQAAGDAAQQRMQQQLAAQGQLGGLLQGQRQQDMGWAANAAQLQQNQFQMNNQLAQGYLSGGFNAANAQTQANIAQQQLQEQAYTNSAGNIQKTTGGLLGGAGGAIGAFLYGGGEVKGYADGGGVGLGYFGLNSAPQAADSSSDSKGGGGLGSILGSFLAGGGAVPGRAKVDRDSIKNDTVMAMLSPGEVVLPRSVTQDPDAADRARDFVAAIKKRKKSA